MHVPAAVDPVGAGAGHAVVRVGGGGGSRLPIEGLRESEERI